MDRILVVDDNPDFLTLMNKVLSKDFIVDVAATAEGGLSLSELNDYKAIILDVSLPDHTGYFLGKTIRKEKPDTPIAFLTNYDGEVSRENAEDVQAEFWRKSDIVSSLKTFPIKIKELYT